MRLIESCVGTIQTSADLVGAVDEFLGMKRGGELALEASERIVAGAKALRRRVHTRL